MAADERVRKFFGFNFWMLEVEGVCESLRPDSTLEIKKVCKFGKFFQGT